MLQASTRCGAKVCKGHNLRIFALDVQVNLTY